MNSRETLKSPKRIENNSSTLFLVGGNICYNASAMPSIVCRKEELFVSAYHHSQSKVQVTSSWTVHAAGRLLNKFCHEKCPP